MTMILERPSDFDRALVARTRADWVYLEPRGQASEAGDEEVLVEELGLVERTIVRFAEAVAAAVEDPHQAASFLRSLDLRLVSRDHDWRAIFAELAGRGPAFDVHRRVLITRYLQYLSERRRLLEMVARRQAALAETRTVPRIERVESKALQSWGVESVVLRKVPAGETVAIALGPGCRFLLRFASRFFRACAGAGSEGRHRTREPGAAREPRLLLTDESGLTRGIRPGRNLLGRHPESDLVVDGAWRDVSRAHAILDHREEESRLLLTAVSRQGTWVQADACIEED